MMSWIDFLIDNIKHVTRTLKKIQPDLAGLSSIDRVLEKLYRDEIDHLARMNTFDDLNEYKV